MPFLLWALVSVFISWTLRVRASLFLYSQRQTLCRKKKVLNNCKLNLIKWFLSPHQLGQSTEIQNQQVLGLLGNKPLTGTVMGIWHKHLFQSPGESGGIAICCFTMWHRISGEKQLQEGRWGEDGSYSFYKYLLSINRVSYPIQGAGHRKVKKTTVFFTLKVFTL